LSEAEGNAGFTVTMKAHGGYDSAWLVVRADTPAQLADRLGAVEAMSIGALIGTAQTAFRAHESVGAILGAKPVTHASTQAVQNNPDWNSPQQPTHAAQTVQYAQPVQQAQTYGAPPQQAVQRPVTNGIQLPPGVEPPPDIHGGVKKIMLGQYGYFWACSGPRGPQQCRAEKYKGPAIQDTQPAF
jgi:hypothetical protein